MGHRIIIQIMQKGLDSQMHIRVGCPAVDSIRVDARDIRDAKQPGTTLLNLKLLDRESKGLLKGNCGEN